MRKKLLRKTIHDHLLELFAEEGIYASGKDDVYGCIFGRDSAITILKILQACAGSKTSEINKFELLAASRRTLLTLSSLQGKSVNFESGEEPGKFIHEYRTSNLERLLNLEKPWFVYPEGVIKNYDSVDATPLGLIAIYRYIKLTQDKEFLYTILPTVYKGLAWIMDYGDRDGDFLQEYEISKERIHGGLKVQSWTDSDDSLTQADGSFPYYPIAPVEVQGYAWLALELWGNYFKIHKEYSRDVEFSSKILTFSKGLKRSFNKQFIIKDNGFYYAAQALDGHKNKIKTVTGNPLLLLWASYKVNGRVRSIVNNRYINDFVKRAFLFDMFDKFAGLRTMSMLSPTFNSSQNSYHNGSFWPKLNGMVYEGLKIWGFIDEARKLRVATIAPIKYFKTPIELYIRTESGEYMEFKGKNGQVSCRNQAWSAAAVLEMLSDRRFSSTRAMRRKSWL